MSIFIDTSAFYALLIANDNNHQSAGQAWVQMVQSRELLLTSNYVVVETYALLQRRLGLLAVRRFRDEVLPVVSIDWVSEPLHDEGVGAVLIADKRNLSLVDCVSFAVMRRLGIRKVFTFDPHFREQGFETIP